MVWKLEGTEGLRAHWEAGKERTEELQKLAVGISEIAARLTAIRHEESDTHLKVGLSHAVDSLAMTLNLLSASADVKCDLSDPPTEVNTRPRGPKHELITMCFHHPPHCWNGMGELADCPGNDN